MFIAPLLCISARKWFYLQFWRIVYHTIAVAFWAAWIGGEVSISPILITLHYITVFWSTQTKINHLTPCSAGTEPLQGLQNWFSWGSAVKETFTCAWNIYRICHFWFPRDTSLLAAYYESLSQNKNDANEVRAKTPNRHTCSGQITPYEAWQQIMEYNQIDIKFYVQSFTTMLSNILVVPLENFHLN